MNGSLGLGRIFGIPVRVHWTMALLLLLYGWGSGLMGLLASTVSLVLLFGSVVAHEVAHALTARAFRIGTSEILLLPFGGMAKIERDPANGKQEVAIALAGPLMSLALSAAAFGLRFLTLPGTFFYSVASTMFFANLVLGVFNLLPAFPMDGGRVLRGALRGRLGLLRATSIAVRVGRFVAVPMAIAGVVWGSFSLVLVAAFVWLAGRSEEQMVRARLQAEEWMPWNVPQQAPDTSRGDWFGRPRGSLFDEARRQRGDDGKPRRFVIEVGPFGYVVREVN